MKSPDELVWVGINQKVSPSHAAANNYSGNSEELLSLSG